MFIHIFGTAAGGGLPQWNCSCLNCRLSRQHSHGVLPQTQSSIGLSDDGVEWVLINASPDIRFQFLSFPPLYPQDLSESKEDKEVRKTNLKSIILTDAQLDHTLGLLTLREGDPLKIYCTEEVSNDLTEEFPVFRILKFYCGWEKFIIPINSYQPDSFVPEGLKNISVTPIPVISKAPPYSPRRNSPQRGDSIALKMRNELNGKTLIYAPNFYELEEHLLEEIQTCQLLLMDGTFWDENELQKQGMSHQKSSSASSMGHRPLSGPHGSLQLMSSFTQCRKILIHINNTNPIFLKDSPQRKLLESLSFELAYDGMDLIL